MIVKVRMITTVMLCLALLTPIFVPASSVTAQSAAGPTVLFLPTLKNQIVLQEKLPDLAMGLIKNVYITDDTVTRVLRFATTVVNIGEGPFEAIGSRADTTVALMDTVHRIYDNAGSYRDVPTTAKMVFAGDGHTHWHLQDLETYELIDLSTSNVVVVGNKVGFCFLDDLVFDLTMVGAPQTQVYHACGGLNSLSLVTGLSIGWADRYRANLPGQDLNITGLPAGVYRLKITSDQANQFLESDETNNVTWMDIRIMASGTDVQIEGVGPGLVLPE